jgi:hypothetical protein
MKSECVDAHPATRPARLKCRNGRLCSKMSCGAMARQVTILSSIRRTRPGVEIAPALRGKEIARYMCSPNAERVAVCRLANM